MRVSLNVVAGPQTGRAFTFDQHDTFMIGRSEDAQFCLPQDRFFSRHHCILEIAPPQAFIRDLGSTNGTFVNGMRVDTAYLKSRVEQSRRHGARPVAVKVCGETTEVWLNDTTGELVLGWIDRDKSEVLVANTANFTVAELVRSAETVTDCCG